MWSPRLLKTFVPCAQVCVVVAGNVKTCSVISIVINHRVSTGEKGVGRSGKPLHFKGSTFHRVITDFMYVYYFVCVLNVQLVWLQHSV